MSVESYPVGGDSVGPGGGGCKEARSRDEF